METEKEIEYKSTIMEMKNIIKNQERVIEQLIVDMLNIKIDIEELDKIKLFLYIIFILLLYYYYYHLLLY
jgi:hypothetical protein